MKPKSLFDKKYRLIMEALDASISDSSKGIDNLKRKYIAKSNFKEAEEADPAAMNAAFESVINETTKAFEAAATDGSEIAVFNPYAWLAATATLQKKDGSDFYYATYKWEGSSDERGSKFKIDDWTWVLESAHEKLIETAKTTAKKYYDEVSKTRAVIESDEFKRFKEELKSKFTAAQMSDIFGDNLKIGRNVPDEFFDVFCKQPDSIKKAFIQHVKDFTTYARDLEMYDGPGYYRATSEGDRNNEIKQAFIERLLKC